MKPLHFNAIQPAFGTGGGVETFELEDTIEGPIKYRVVHYWNDGDWVSDQCWADTDFMIGHCYIPGNWCWI